MYFLFIMGETIPLVAGQTTFVNRNPNEGVILVDLRSIMHIAPIDEIYWGGKAAIIICYKKATGS